MILTQDGEVPIDDDGTRQYSRQNGEVPSVDMIRQLIPT